MKSSDVAEAELLHQALLGASTFLERALQDLLAAESITPSQLYVLRTLGASAGHALSPKALQRSFVRPRNLTETVDRLVRAGLVERRPNPEDRRSVLIAPTERGEQVRARASEVYHEGIVRLLGRAGLGSLGPGGPGGVAAADAAVVLEVLQRLTTRLRGELYPDLPMPGS